MSQTRDSFLCSTDSLLFHLFSTCTPTLLLLISTILLIPLHQSLLRSPIFPPRLLTLTRLLLTLPMRLDRRPTLRPPLQRLDFLREHFPRYLAILRAGSCFLAGGEDTRGEMFQLDRAGGFVDFLTAGAAAVDEGFADFVFAEFDAWGERFCEGEGTGGEESGSEG